MSRSCDQDLLDSLQCSMKFSSNVKKTLMTKESLDQDDRVDVPFILATLALHAPSPMPTLMLSHLVSSVQEVSQIPHQPQVNT